MGEELGNYFYICPPVGSDNKDLEGKDIESDSFLSLKHQLTGLYVGCIKGCLSPATKQGEVCCFTDPNQNHNSKIWLITDISSDKFLRRGFKFRLKYIYTFTFLSK